MNHLQAIPRPEFAPPVADVDPEHVARSVLTDVAGALANIDAAASATDEDALKAAKAACDALSRADAGVLLLNTRAHRTLGRIIRDGAHPDHVIRRNGITRYRARFTEQLSLIPQEELDGYILDTMARDDREVTMAGVKALLPSQPRELPKSVTPEIAAPSIDVAIARQYGIEVADARAELIAASVSDTLSEMDNEKRYIYMHRHGITESGAVEGESWSMKKIANRLGKARESIRPLYFEAKAEVMEQLAADALAAVPH